MFSLCHLYPNYRAEARIEISLVESLILLPKLELSLAQKLQILV